MLQRLNQNIFKRQKLVPLGKLLQSKGRGGSAYFATLDDAQRPPGRFTADHGAETPSSGQASETSLPESFRHTLDQFDAQYEQPEDEDLAAASNSVSQWPIQGSNFKIYM